MKSIELYTAVVDNGGTRRDAGETVAIGDAGDQISNDRATDLVDRQQAVPVEVVQQQSGGQVPDALDDVADDGAKGKGKGAK